jgi:hypothetical protein
MDAFSGKSAGIVMLLMRFAQTVPGAEAAPPDIKSAKIHRLP